MSAYPPLPLPRKDRTARTPYGAFLNQYKDDKGRLLVSRKDLKRVYRSIKDGTPNKYYIEKTNRSKKVCKLPYYKVGTNERRPENDWNRSVAIATDRYPRADHKDMSTQQWWELFIIPEARDIYEFQFGKRVKSQR
jgi:hypothetical protein